MIIHSNLSQMKNKILPNCLQGNYRGSLGEFHLQNKLNFVYYQFRYICNYHSLINKKPQPFHNIIIFSHCITVGRIANIMFVIILGMLSTVVVFIYL